MKLYVPLGGPAVQKKYSAKPPRKLLANIISLITISVSRDSGFGLLSGFFSRHLEARKLMEMSNVNLLPEILLYVDQALLGSNHFWSQPGAPDRRMQISSQHSQEKALSQIFWLGLLSRTHVPT